MCKSFHTFVSLLVLTIAAPYCVHENVIQYSQVKWVNTWTAHAHMHTHAHTSAHTKGYAKFIVEVCPLW
jgi:hypothetical protein